MRGSAKNIQRDGLHYYPAGTANKIPWVTNAVNISGPVGSNPIGVFYDYGWAISDTTVTTTIGPSEYATLGVYMDPPRADRIPYRVQASVNTLAALFIGYGPPDITGTSHSVLEPGYIPFVGTFDGVILLEPDNGTYKDRPVYIGVATAEQVNNAYVTGFISVQNLGIKPPTMQISTS